MKKICLKNSALIFGAIIIGIISLVIINSCTQQIQLKDAHGKTQSFDKPITRVVGSHNPTLNSVVAIGGGGKYLCGFGFKEKADGLYREVIDNWDELKTVYQDHDFDMDAIRSMNAELAILPESQEKRISEFAEAGVPSFILQPKHESLEVVKESINKLGILFGDKDRADELNNMFDEILADVRNSLKDCSANKRIVFMGSSTNEVVTTEMIQNNIIEEAKGINAIADYDKNYDDVNFESGSYAKVELETIAKSNPDFIAIPNYAKFKIEDIYKCPELANTPAVINKQVYIFPSLIEPWDYSTLSCVLGICCTANFLHPELYSREKLFNACDKFYKTLYNKTFSAEKLGI